MMVEVESTSTYVNEELAEVLAMEQIHVDAGAAGFRNGGYSTVPRIAPSLFPWAQRTQ